MPITRKQFAIGIDPKTEEWMRKINGFLAERKDEAFTGEELREHYEPTLVELLSDTERKIIQQPSVQADAFHFLPDERFAFDLALEKLEELKVTVKHIIRGTEYYVYRRSLEGVL